MLKKNKIVLLAAFAGLICIIGCLLWIEFQPAEIPFYLEAQGENGTEQYACWRGENQQCYVFLPSYVEFSKSRIVMNTGDTLFLDGESLNEETDCSEFLENHIYDLTYDGLFGQQQFGLTFVKSGYIPVVHIDTESGDMEYVHGQKGNEEKAAIRIYDADGTLVCNDSLKSIAGRGNSTFGDEKKPYIIKFTEPKNLLGMGAAYKWILLANAFDLTNLRNYLVVQTAKKIGIAYTPDMQWVELYLNREYAGLYMLSEKIEVSENRVNISQHDSYLFSLEDRGRIITQNLPHYDTAAGQTVRIRYPEYQYITANDTIAVVIQRAENAIMREDGIDPVSGSAWNELIDIDSWARKYLVEEIFACADAGKWSQYFYVSGKNRKICAGPVWDYDLSMAISWQFAIPNIWYCNRLTAGGEPLAPWFEALSRKPAFMHHVVEIYKTEVLPILVELINEGIDEAAEKVAQSSKINAIRWSGAEKSEGEVWRIQKYLQERIEFLNDIWIEGTEYVTVRAYLGSQDGYVDLIMPADSPMDTLPAAQEKDLLGWYWAVDGTPVEPKQKVVPNAEIYALRGEKRQQNDRVIKLIPISVIAMMGIAIAGVELFRLKSKRWDAHG